MRHTLPVLIHGQAGPLEAELWWIDPARLCLVGPERFGVGRALALRVDLGSGDGHVDLAARVIAVGERKFGGSYVLATRWMVDQPAAERRMIALGRVLNPDAGWEGQRSRPVGGPRPLQPSSPRPLPARPAREASPQARPASVQLSPGEPPALYVGLTDVAQLREVLTLRPGVLCLTLPRVEGLRTKQVVRVALRLPTGVFVDLEARVAVRRRGQVVLACRRTPPETRTMLSELLSGAAAA